MTRPTQAQIVLISVYDRGRVVDTASFLTANMDADVCWRVIFDMIFKLYTDKRFKIAVSSL